MADVTENSLRAVVKALTDVIGPALDKSDPLANEQLRLVVDYLEFVRSRLDYLYDRDRFELCHDLAMARSLKDLDPPCSAATADALQTAIESGAEAYACAGTPMPALKMAAARLAAVVRVLVREASAFDEGKRGQIERRVLDASEEQIAFERCWYMPLGFDPSPGEVLTMAAALGGAEISRISSQARP
jgi:hypothetical protein